MQPTQIEQTEETLFSQIFKAIDDKELVEAYAAPLDMSFVAR